MLCSGDVVLYSHVITVCGYFSVRMKSESSSVSAEHPYNWMGSGDWKKDLWWETRRYAFSSHHSQARGRGPIGFCAFWFSHQQNRIDIGQQLISSGVVLRLNHEDLSDTLWEWHLFFNLYIFKDWWSSWGTASLGLLVSEPRRCLDHFSLLITELLITDHFR